jgi:hypothetical protein
MKSIYGGSRGASSMLECVIYRQDYEKKMEESNKWSQLELDELNRIMEEYEQ